MRARVRHTHFPTHRDSVETVGLISHSFLGILFYSFCRWTWFLLGAASIKEHVEEIGPAPGRSKDGLARFFSIEFAMLGKTLMNADSVPASSRNQGF